MQQSNLCAMCNACQTRSFFFNRLPSVSVRVNFSIVLLTLFFCALNKISYSLQEKTIHIRDKSLILRSTYIVYESHDTYTMRGLMNLSRIFLY